MKLLLNPTAPNEIGPKHIADIDRMWSNINQGIMNWTTNKNSDITVRVMTHMFGAPGWHRRVLCQGVWLSLGMV